VRGAGGGPEVDPAGAEALRALGTPTDLTVSAKALSFLGPFPTSYDQDSSDVEEEGEGEGGEEGEVGEEGEDEGDQECAVREEDVDRWSGEDVVAWAHLTVVLPRSQASCLASMTGSSLLALDPDGAEARAVLTAAGLEPASVDAVLAARRVHVWEFDTEVCGCAGGCLGVWVGIMIMLPSLWQQHTPLSTLHRATLSALGVWEVPWRGHGEPRSFRWPCTCACACDGVAQEVTRWEWEHVQQWARTFLGFTREEVDALTPEFEGWYLESLSEDQVPEALSQGSRAALWDAVATKAWTRRRRQVSG
jgi:hypothetical protein